MFFRSKGSNMSCAFTASAAWRTRVTTASYTAEYRSGNLHHIQNVLLFFHGLRGLENVSEDGLVHECGSSTAPLIL